ncbi:MAG TPA: hypothetical protein VK983_05795 [Candidatus Limnocylindrales bacterium]|nr:hypothetical protein [Candidatus Limnocylindrales bacterium]
MIHDISLDVVPVHPEELTQVKGGSPQIGDMFKLGVNEWADQRSEVGPVVHSYLGHLEY